MRPTLVPLTVDAIPENVLPYANLSNLLSREDGDKLCRTTSRAANYRSPPDTALSLCPLPSTSHTGAPWLLHILQEMSKVLSCES